MYRMDGNGCKILNGQFSQKLYMIYEEKTQLQHFLCGDWRIV